MGGAIGVFGVWWAFRLQRRAAARDDVDRAVETLLNRISDHVEAAQAYTAEFNITRLGREKLVRTFPHAAPVSIAVDVLRMRTSGDEREVADQLADTWKHVARSSASARGIAAGHMATAITQWRLRERRATILDTLDLARQLSLPEGTIDIVADTD